MISMPCTGLWYWVFQTLKLGVPGSETFGAW